MTRIELAQTLWGEIQEARRLERPGYLVTDYRLLCWTLHEQEQMLAIVNARRKTPATLQDIQRIKQRCVMAHGGYTRNFLSYCADLVMEDSK